MSNWQSAICKANGIHIHYTRTGGDKPPVVLLHGLMTNGLCWTGLAHALENEYDVIMPDARGHGNSGVPDFGYRYEDLANDVIQLIDTLQLPAPILLGHSMGGLTAAVVASSKPINLRAIILDDPTFLSLKAQRKVRDSDVADGHRRMLSKSFDEIVADARERHPTRSEEAIALFARARLQTSMAALDVLTPPNPDYKLLVSTINIPSIIIFSDGGIVSPDVANDLQRLNPRLQAEQIKEAGHNIHIDQPERFADVVKTFLRSL